MAKRIRNQPIERGRNASSGKFMRARRETPPHMYSAADGVETVPPSVNAAVVIPKPAPPQSPTPVLRSELASGQPPDPDPAFVSGPVVVSDRLEVRAGGATLAVHRQVALIQLSSLIAAFQEVGDYEPRRHHNTPRPALWLNDKDYLGDVKALLHQLRRLNDLLEGHADRAKVERSGSIVASLADKVCHSAADVIGKGLGAVVLGSIALVLVELGVADVAKVLPTTMKAGR